MAQTEKPIQHSAGRKGWSLYFTIPILSWAFYDFANTIFSSNINTIFFPFYLQEVVGTNEVLDQVASTFISYSNAVASFFLVLFSPLFGVMIDRTGQKKKYIVIFTLFTVTLTALMGIFGGLEDVESKLFGLPLSLVLVIVCFVLAKFFYHSSLIFYDSMISDLGTKQEIPLISGFGVAVGYIGTLVGLAVYPFIGEEGFHRAFIPTALLFFVFSLPLFFNVREKPKREYVKMPFFSGYKEIRASFQDMKQYKTIFTFMIAYFFVNDSISTAISMMAIYSKAIVGFSTGQFILLYLVSTISSIIGSFVFGYVAKAKGSKNAFFYVVLLLLVALTLATFAVNQLMFWTAGSLFGIALGSMWVTSRSLIVELTPEDKRGQFFGLFAFSGKVSSILGPALYGTITLVFRDLGDTASRMAFGSLILVTLLGLLMHRKILSSK